MSYGLAKLGHKGFMVMMRDKVLLLLVCVLMLIGIVSPMSVSAQAELSLDAAAAILVEQTTGRILYSRNPHARMYPASTTKLLTALVAVAHLDLDTVVVIGPEIRQMPAGFATNLHIEGEYITVRMLLKALLIRSSNEASRILALETIRTIQDRQNIPYSEAKGQFSALMNATARSLGTRGSNFNNPYGFHSEAHFTTAYDMALIARAFMSNPTLVELSAPRHFIGDGLEGRYYPDAIVRDYSLVNTNLMLPGAQHGHPYIISGRTGFTTPAGHCFVGAAYHNGLQLVAVVLNSGDITRWQDTRVLLDYGFFNYEFRQITTPGMLLDTVEIENPRLGDSNTLDILLPDVLPDGNTMLLSRAEYASLQRTITFNPIFLVEHDGDYIKLRTSIEKGEQVGTVVYTVGSEVVLTTVAIASRYVAERTFDTDMDYYMAIILNNIFTRRGLPYWFGFVGTIVGIVGICIAISAKRNSTDRPFAGRRRYR